MNQLIKLCFIFCVAPLISSNIFATEIRDYPLTKIAARTYVIYGALDYPTPENQGFMNNPGFVITNDGVVVIDPGSSVYVGRMLLKKIRELTPKPVTHVFNTHVHGDHWFGNQAIIESFPNAKLLGHPEMIKKIDEGEGEFWLAQIATMTKGLSKGTRSVPPTVAVNDGAEFKIGGITFRIYAPENAHSHTDIMIEAVEESVIFTGDNVLNQITARMLDSTFTGNIAACNKIAAINAKHYIPGHGPAGDASIVIQYRDYLAILYATAKQQYDLGKADFEMKDTVIAKLKKYQGWARFNTEVGQQISVAVLELEAAQ